MFVHKLSCGPMPVQGEPCIVSNNDDGTRYWCFRRRSLATSWLELDVFDWVDEYGWDTLPVRRQETLEAIDKAMKDAGL